MCSLGSSSMVCSLQGDFQLISRLRLWREFMILFQHCAPGMIIKRVQIWRVWGHLFFSVNLGQFACSHEVLHDARTLRIGGRGCLGQNSIILSFSNVFQQKLAVTCIFYCLTVGCKIVEMSTKVTGRLLFMFILYILESLQVS